MRPEIYLHLAKVRQAELVRAADGYRLAAAARASGGRKPERAARARGFLRRQVTLS
jgi:hypothetical protein